MKTDQLKPYNVMQIDGLTVKQIIAFAEKKFDLHKYMPDYKKPRQPDRQWLCNLSKFTMLLTIVVNTKIGTEF